MISKIASLCLFLAVASAGHIAYNGHDHGHYQGSGQAVSSQKIVQDFTPSHQNYHHLQHQHNFDDLHQHDFSDLHQHINLADLHQHSLGDIHYHDSHQYEHQNSHPKYDFEYSVNDPETQDQKSHRESRDGDNVEGEYSLLQPDGKTRTVTYKADKEGFQAQVSTTGDENSYNGHYHQHGQVLDLSHQQYHQQHNHGLDHSQFHQHY